MLSDQVRAFLADPRAAPPLPELPEPAAPSLEGLRVVVPALEELTTERLLELYEERVRATAPRTRRPVGEFAEPGDAVRVRLGAWSEAGEALPFTFQDQLELVAGGSWLLEELPGRLVGVTEGELLEVPVHFPPDWPATALRGVLATFRVRVLRVERVEPPGPDELTLDERMAALRAEWIEARSDELVALAGDRALDLLRERAPVEISPTLVDCELWWLWAKSEGRLVLELRGTEADLHGTLAGWLRSEALRSDVTRRLHVALVLRSIARSEGIALSPEATSSAASAAPKALEDTIRPASEQVGVQVEEVLAQLRADPGHAALVADRALHRELVRTMLARAEVRFLPP